MKNEKSSFSGGEIEVSCPDDTAFDPSILTCNYIDLVAGCEYLNGISKLEKHFCTQFLKDSIEQMKLIIN